MVNQFIEVKKVPKQDFPLPGKSPEGPKEDSIIEKLNKQMDRLIYLGLHDKLGQSREEFESSKPRLTDNPSGILKFDPLIVYPQISSMEFHELQAKANLVVTAHEVNLDHFETETGDKPYLIWVRSGKHNRYSTPEEAKRFTFKTEEGLNPIELDFYYFQYEKELKGNKLVSLVTTYKDDPRVYYSLRQLPRENYRTVCSTYSVESGPDIIFPTKYKATLNPLS